MGRGKENLTDALYDLIQDHLESRENENEDYPQEIITLSEKIKNATGRSPI